MNNYNIEKGLISKLVETKDINLIKDMQIKNSYFSRENKQVFKFINDYYFKNSEVPTSRVILNSFPNYKFETYVNKELIDTVGTDEPLLHWCNEIRAKAKHNKLVDSIESVVDDLENLDTDKAYDRLKKTILYIENEVELTSSIDITKDTDSRKLAYKKRKENQGMQGIPMGIDKLDYILKGMQEKQLITMIAKTGVGKTWFEILIGAYACLNNYRVLQFTTEMSEEQIQDRYEAMLVGIMLGEFNYNKFKSGTLSKEQEEMYFDFLDNTLPKLEPIIIETATGVSNMSAKIDQYQPDLVLVDSAYLMEDDRGAKEDWLRVAHITRDIKALAKRKKLPIFINSQADSTTSKKTGPELENMSFAKSIGQDSDVVMSLFRDEYMIQDRETKVKILKQREGILGSVMLNWDFTTMDFSSIYAENQEGNELSEDDTNSKELNSNYIEV